MKPTASISSLQLFFFILQSQVGISILSMPYATFKIAKTDSWLVVILSGFVVQFFILIIWILGTRFPSCTIFEIQEKILGKKIGKVITGAYIIYFLLATSLFLSIFSNIIKLWLLPTTPSWLLILLMLGISIYMVKENLQILSRFFVLTAILFVLFLILILYSFKQANILNILPIGKVGIVPIVKGMWQEIQAFLGFEMLLILFPYVKTSNIMKLKVTTYANICTTCFYTLLTFACLLFFSPDEMAYIPQPVLYATKSFELSIMERPDILFTSTWIVIVTSTIMAFLYAASKGMTYMLSQYHRKTYIYWGAGVVFVITTVWNKPSWIPFLSTLVSTSGLILAGGMPTVLLLLSLLLKQAEQPGDML